MTLKAGFAEIDVTPPVGTHKIGWLKDIVSDHVLDQLFARACVLESAGTRIGFIQLDTLFVDAADVAEIRRRISAQHGLPGENVMVAATHNHAGPAVADAGDVRRDEAYVRTLVESVVSVFGQALEGTRPAEFGFARRFEFDVGHNRRVLMRDGTVRTHGTFADPNALCLEGPIDPEVAVLGVRAAGEAPNRHSGNLETSGELLGALVNYACHPTHHGPDGALTAGYPGVLAAEMKKRGCPVTMFLLGAAGNIACADPARGGEGMPMQQAGRKLADHVAAALSEMEFTDRVELGARSRTLQLPFRRPTPEQIAGTARGAQRFVDPAIYERIIPAQAERIRRLKTQPSEVQVLSINDVAFASIGGEYFAEFGLRIKQACWPRRALVVTCANGRAGYIPTKEAFDRGGYETTFGPPSTLAPEAGDLLADAAIELIGQG